MTFVKMTTVSTEHADVQPASRWTAAWHLARRTVHLGADPQSRHGALPGSSNSPSPDARSEAPGCLYRARGQGFFSVRSAVLPSRCSSSTTVMPSWNGLFRASTRVRNLTSYAQGTCEHRLEFGPLEYLAVVFGGEEHRGPRPAAQRAGQTHERAQSDRSRDTRCEEDERTGRAAPSVRPGCRRCRVWGRRRRESRRPPIDAVEGASNLPSFHSAWSAAS